MFFIVILILTTLALAGSAAYFSVYGLAQVFTGAFWSVVLMGSALEAGKLVASSFLYRFWHKTSLFLRAYLFVAIIVLMGITSMGISGYLTAAYQTDTVGLRDEASQLSTAKEELDRLVARKADMDKQIADVPPAYVSAKQRLIKTFAPEYERINPRIIELQTQVTSLTTNQLTKEAKVGPIIFISRVLGKETDDAIFWLVILLVVVFDPLAVALTIATNIAIQDRLERKTKPLPAASPPPTTESAGLDDIRSTLSDISEQVSDMTETNRKRAEVRNNINE